MNKQKQRQSGMSHMAKLTFACVFFITVAEGVDLGTLSVALAVVMQDFGLNAAQGGLIISVSTGGMMFGGLVCGWLADRIGRLKTTRIAVLTFSVFILLSTITEDFTLFCMIRFVSSAGMSGVWSSGVVMVSEYVPTSKRNTILGLIQGGSALGYVAAALLNGVVTPLYGWRPIVLVTTVCGIMALFFSRILQEPPSYLASRTFQKQERKSAGSFRILFSDGNSVRTLVKWILCSILLQAGYYAANSWLPTYMTAEFGVEFRKMTWFIAGSYAMMFLGKFLAGILSDHIGRKIIWFGACICTAAVLPIIIHFASAANIGIIILAFGFFYGAPMAMCSTFMSESFPTGCRGTGTSLSYNSGRIGAMISPVLIGALAADLGTYAVGFLLIAAFYFVCGITVLFIREKQFDPKQIQRK